MAEEMKTVDVVFEKSKNAITFCATDAFGGPIPDGTMLMVHFYSEGPPVPSYTRLEVNEQGEVNLSKGENISRGDIVREVQATMLITPKAAENLANWLLNHVERLKQR